jgi:disulfide bond formation protein DsbB
MYPLAIILLIAAYRREGMIRVYAATLASIGAAIAAYHRLVQAYPSIDGGACSASGPSCTAPLIMKFNFVTIPYMALSAFVLILTLLWVDRMNERLSDGSADEETGDEAKETERA